MYRIVRKEALRPTVTLYEIEAPLVAKKAQPGQFIILRVDENGERIPITINDYNPEKGTVTIIVQTVGATTEKLSRMKEGDSLQDFVGPLGKATETEGKKKVCVVGGGVGCAIAYPVLKMQRQLARENSVVMDGRDIGTVVLPDAEVKVFLTASAEERARRRMLELEELGTPEPYAAILRAIQERDWNDTHRDAAPLRQAEDAVLLDTTALDFVQSEDALLHIIRERTGL